MKWDNLVNGDLSPGKFTTCDSWDDPALPLARRASPRQKSRMETVPGKAGECSTCIQMTRQTWKQRKLSRFIVSNVNSKGRQIWSVFFEPKIWNKISLVFHSQSQLHESLGNSPKLMFFWCSFQSSPCSLLGLPAPNPHCFTWKFKPRTLRTGPPWRFGSCPHGPKLPTLGWDFELKVTPMTPIVSETVPKWFILGSWIYGDFSTSIDPDWS